MSWLYLGFAILCEVIGTSLLSISEGFSKWVPTTGCIGAFIISFFFLSLALKTIPVGIAYAIWSGTGIVLISVVGFTFLGQRLDNAALLGLGLILSGVLVIHLFSSSSVH